MPKIKEKFSGYISGRPSVVARHIELPVTLYHEPDRPMVVLIPLSKVPVHVRAMARIWAKATSRRAAEALPDSPDFLELGDGAGDGEDERPDA